jgi:glycosyltransferase involved in cell wall biosynthesis
MKLISIIIPIYNVEPYIEKCLRSIEDQDIPRDDFEIICVNDGSPDNSREVVLRLSREFGNIILIDQENQGVSRARNNGSRKAGGKYMLFVDPDDLLHTKCLGTILKDAISKQVQIVIPGYSFIDIDDNLVDESTYSTDDEKVLSGVEAYNISHVKGQMGADLAVGIIFDANFLNSNNLGFLPDVPFLEDGEFLARAHCLAGRCLVVKQNLYKHVVVREGSATHSNLFDSERARKGFELAAKNLRSFQQTPSLDIRQKMFINGPVAQFVLLTVYSALRARSVKILKASVNSLQVSGLGKLTLEGCKGWYLICGKPYNLSPYLGALALSLYLKADNWKSKLFKKKSLKN